MKKQKLIVARSWRKFGRQQVVAIGNLVEAIGDHFDLDFYLCINDTDDMDEYAQEASKLLNVNLNIISTEELDKYAMRCGVSEKKHVDKFKQWKWIYHLILYHQLYHERKVEYILSYDDDIFFQNKMPEAIGLLANQIPFSIEDQHSDSDKCMMGKLVEYFGSKLVDDYYSCFANHVSSNSGFMGISLKNIFQNFSPGRDFIDMIEMFEYRPYFHDSKEKEWKDYKILLQEQSFLGILNRTTSNKTHIVLEKKDGYSVADLQNSKIQHYVAAKKYERDYLKRVNDAYTKILFKKK